MSNFIKVLLAACVLGIAAVWLILMLLEPTPQVAPTPITPTLTPDQTSSFESAEATEPGTVEEPIGETVAPAFWIEELTAECDESEGVGVSDLVLGADWRTTERGVYANSPVLITCVTGGSSDDLVFEWSANFGEIEGSGASIVWEAPGHGAKAQVSVVVRDGTDNEETGSLNFRVATCECIYQRY